MRSRNRRHDVPLLFKYTTADTAKKVLATRSLRWSSPLLFNDPFDIRRDFELPFSNKEFGDAVISRIRAYYNGEATPRSPTALILVAGLRVGASRGIPESILWEDLRSTLAMTVIPMEVAREQFRSIWTDRVPGMRILCFSADPESPSMWAHYADDQSGAVLGFESNDERDNPWLLAQPVIYRDSPPTLPGADAWALAMLGEDSLDWEVFLQDYYFAKSPDWSTEKEYRVPTDKKRHEEGLFSDWTFASEDLREIRLGPKMTSGDEAMIRMLVKQAFPHANVRPTRLEARLRRIIAL